MHSLGYTMLRTEDSMLSFTLNSEVVTEASRSRGILRFSLYPMTKGNALDDRVNQSTNQISK